MPGCLRSPVYFNENTSRRMAEDSTYRLTHPELMTETELREILKNSCIDFSNFEKLCRTELIETYKRVAMPLPQRQNEDTLNFGTEDKNSDSEFGRSSPDSSNNVHSSKRSLNDSERLNQSSRSPTNESDKNQKKIRLNKGKNGAKCNGVDKRTNDGKDDESPLKKRQKITWP